MTHELFAMLCRSALAAGVALSIVLVLRLPARRWFGAACAYRLWLSVPIAALAIVLPAPVRPLVKTAHMVQSAPVATPSISLTAAAIESPIDWQAWLLGIWIIGALALLTGFVWQQRRYLKHLGALAADDHGALRAQTSAGCPALVGALRPRIVLPSDFESRYTPRERELVLVHERTHLARGDAQINALVALLRCLNWFNPLFHFAASRFRLDQELACDALVVARFPESAKAYANAMLKAQLVGELRQELHLPAGCYWPSSHPLKERIAMLKFPVLNPRRRVLASVVIVLLALGGGYVSWAAQPGRANSNAMSPAVVGNTDAPLVQIDFRMDIDGEPTFDSQNVKSHCASSNSCWRIDTAADHAHMLEDATGQSIRLFNASSGEFAVRAIKGDERWDLAGTPVSRGDGTIEFNATVKHNDTVVSKLSLVIVNGKTASLEIQVPDNAKSKFGFALTATLVDAAHSPIAAEPVSEQASLPSDSAPSEIIEWRKKNPPKYPVAAVKAGVQGSVTLKVHVDPSGMPASAEVVKIDPPTSTVLADAAVAAAMQWRFNPASKDGKPVDGFVLVPVDFQLSEDDGTPIVAQAPPTDLAASYRIMRPPEYPAEAIASKVGGKVFVKARINADGTVGDAKVDQAYPSSPI